MTTPPVPDPREWVEGNINLDLDMTSAVGGYVKLDNYQAAPFRAQFDPAVRLVVLQWIEQAGKSSIWRWALLYKMLFKPAPRMVLFESAEKAATINQRTFEPLVSSVPELAEMLNRQSSQAGSYSLPNGAIVDFLGGGISLTSKPAMDVVLDEVDSYCNFDEGDRRFRDAEKRVRTYARRGEGCITVSCTPKTNDGRKSATAAIFSTTNKSYWTLRCRKCQKLTMRSCDIINLQADKTEEGAVIPGTIRLICPVCGYEHEEGKDAEWMNAEGGYVSMNPEITDRMGYQLGALGCPRVFSWTKIMEARLASGKSAGLNAVVDFYNSTLGLPYEEKEEGEGREEKIKKRCVSLPKDEDIDLVVMGCDTQDDGWYYCIRAVDKRKNSYLVDCGFRVMLDELEEVWEKKYCGRWIDAGIIDEGGHRGTAVRKFCLEKKGFLQWKGGYHARRGMSKNIERLLCCSEVAFRSLLLHLIYNKSNQGDGGWFLPHDVSKEYVDMIADVRPGTTKNGHFFENWVDTKKNHYFDVEKQILALVETIYEDREARSKIKKVKATSYYQ